MNVCHINNMYKYTWGVIINSWANNVLLTKLQAIWRDINSILLYFLYRSELQKSDFNIRLYESLFTNTFRYLKVSNNDYRAFNKLARNLLTWFLQITACTKVPCYMLIRKWIPNNETIQQCRIT